MKEFVTKVFFPLIFISLSGHSFAQYGQWTWMGGDSVYNSVAQRGNLGVPSVNYNPGARYEAMTFTDTQNNFWLYGGQLNVSGVAHWYSDLWKYDPSTGEWTWVKGPSAYDVPAVPGTVGVPSSLNNPPAIMAACSWSDPFNNLWIFGGGTNNLWRYSITSNQWTLMKAGPARFGARGVMNGANNPPSRDEATCSWQVGETLWLFGGRKTGNGFLNDLWKFSIISNAWTWMGGDSIVNVQGMYGTRGIPSPNNKPGARSAYCSWYSNFKLWLFGGNETYYHNDLWSFDPFTSEWTWVSGDSTPSMLQGFYGNQCVASPLNVPGHRTENKTSWTDLYGNLWMYGGSWGPADLWKFDLNLNQWVWVMGDTVLRSGGLRPIYGVKGVPSIFNTPGSRNGTPSWKSSDGSFWLYGGIFQLGAKRNDLWKYMPDTAAGACSYVGIREMHPAELADCKVYSNPARDFCTVEFADLKGRKIALDVFDIRGSVIWKQDVLQPSTTVDLSGPGQGHVFYPGSQQGSRKEL
jgi:hypothetical protein